MPLIPRTTKGPSASYAHTFEFGGWPQLVDPNSGVTLSSATASVSPSGLTLGTVTVDSDLSEAYVPMSGGTLGQTYRITCLATLSNSDVIDGYVDVTIAIGPGEGAVIVPSQLLPYFDNVRAMELLYDENELGTNESTGDPNPIPSSDTIDGNDRAFWLSQSTWRNVLEACRRGNLYSANELRDLAYDPVRGQDLIELIANGFWCRLINRRRYTEGEPQAKDPACEDFEKRLQALREGERIFDLTGVLIRDDNGELTGSVYGNPLGDASAISVGTLGSTDRDCQRLAPFWGCTNDLKRFGRRSGRGCC